VQRRWCSDQITQLAQKQRCAIMELQPLVTGPQSGSLTL
jgi:hypothetical protein